MGSNSNETRRLDTILNIKYTYHKYDFKFCDINSPGEKCLVVEVEVAETFHSLAVVRMIASKEILNSLRKTTIGWTGWMLTSTKMRYSPKGAVEEEDVVDEV